MPFVAVCCFCGRDVRRNGLEPLSVAVFASGSVPDTEQTFWCHRACLAMAVYDTSILREELGGQEIDFSRLRKVSRAEQNKILGKLKAFRKRDEQFGGVLGSTPQSTHQMVGKMGRKSKNGPNERKAKVAVPRRKSGS